MLSIIVPTYNEAENIQPLLEEVKTVLDDSIYSPYEILVVDDDSPDETWRLASQVTDDNTIRVIRRQGDRGLAKAVLRGIQETQYKYNLVMDADFQHPPSTITRLVERLEAGDDIVVASRYVEDGSIRDFGPVRTAISMTANTLARAILKEVRPIKDPLAGFFAFRKSVIADELPRPLGYKILLTLLVHGTYESVSEVGYTFESRRAGESKLGVKNIYYFMAHLMKLYFS